MFIAAQSIVEEVYFQDAECQTEKEKSLSATFRDESFTVKTSNEN